LPKKGGGRNDHWDHWFWSTLGADNARLLATYVDGATAQENSAYQDWNRGEFTTVISAADWDELKSTMDADQLERFFDVRKVNAEYHLKFKDGDGLAESVPGIARYVDKGRGDARALLRFIIHEVEKIKDPVQRAARILHLFTKLHPFRNGNGRTARLWAAQELVQGGYPMPVGLPTNDFFMSQRQIELEVRKAVKLGQLWEEMLKDAHRRGVSPNDFFQSVFRGSTLEGLLLISPRDPGELANYVLWLEHQTSAPAWAKEFAAEVEREISSIRETKGAVAKSTEAERSIAMDRLWQTFKARNKITIPLDPALSHGESLRAFLRACSKQLRDLR
jgi:prophage maintenance system killer protein